LHRSSGSRADDTPDFCAWMRPSPRGFAWARWGRNCLHSLTQESKTKPETHQNECGKKDFVKTAGKKLKNTNDKT
jgi:hypothetical protein